MQILGAILTLVIQLAWELVKLPFQIAKEVFIDEL